ncbi:MAG: hypothetical protein AB2556_21160, partial [Candidatus Thiodiazotropha sp.]
MLCIPCLLEEEYLPPVEPAQWRDKGEKICMPQEYADYRAEPAWVATKKNLTPSTAPRHDDPLSRNAMSYLKGGWGSVKTSRAIELFRQKD